MSAGKLARRKRFESRRVEDREVFIEYYVREVQEIKSALSESAFALDQTCNMTAVMRILIRDRLFLGLLLSEKIDSMPRALVVRIRSAGDESPSGARDALKQEPALAPRAASLFPRIRIQMRTIAVVEKMPKHRQVCAVRAMRRADCFTPHYALQLRSISEKALAGHHTPGPQYANFTAPERASMESELDECRAKLQRQGSASALRYLQYLAIKRYARRLVENERISRYLMARQPQALRDLSDVAA